MKYESNKGAKRYIFYAVVFGFIIMSGLRWRTGADWEPYYSFFTVFHLLPRGVFEPSYEFLNALAIWINNDFTTLLFFQAFIALYLRGVFLYKYSMMVLLSLLLYLGNNIFDIAPIRQTMAISVALLGTPFIIKKQYVKFTLIIFAALSFHLTAFIFFFAYFAYHWKWGVWSKVVCLFISIIIGFSPLGNMLIDILIQSLPGGFSITEKAAVYAELNEEGGKTLKSLISGLLKRSIIIPVLLYYEYYSKDKDPYFKPFMNIFVLGNIIYFLLGTMGFGVGRLASYYNPFEIIVVCRMTYFSYYKKVWYIVFVFYALVKLTFQMSSVKDYYVPFYWKFSESTPRPENTNF